MSSSFVQRAASMGVKLRPELRQKVFSDLSWIARCDCEHVVYVLGDQGTGKTALCFGLLSDYVAQGRSCFVFRHPRGDLLPEGIRVAHDLGMVERLPGCVLYIDEPQLHFPVGDKKVSESLRRLLSTARQNGVTVILSSCDPRAVPRSIESFVTVTIVLDTDPEMLKNGSRAKNLIKRFALDWVSWRAVVGEGLVGCRRFPEYCGRFSFVPPSFYSVELSKSYRRQS